MLLSSITDITVASAVRKKTVGMRSVGTDAINREEIMSRTKLLAAAAGLAVALAQYGHDGAHAQTRSRSTSM